MRILRIGFAVAASLIALAAAAVTASAAGERYTWRNVVVKGGGFVSGLVFHPRERGLLYARTDVGGAYRWEPAAKKWLALNDDLGAEDVELTGVISLALDPQDASRVYLACGQYLPDWAHRAAILSSVDRGATWTRTDLPLKLGGNWDGRSMGERLQVDPHDGRVLLLGTNQDGLWRSEDRAKTWRRVENFAPTSVALVVLDERSGEEGKPTPTIYVGAATTKEPALWRSTDGGATWRAVPGQPTGLMPHHAKLAADGTLFIAYGNHPGPNDVTRGAVMRLNPASGEWRDITPSRVGAGGYAGLSLDPQRPGTVLVTTLDHWDPLDEIFLTRNGGETWTALGPRSTIDTSPAPYAGTNTVHWMGAIEIDPFDSARAWFTTGYGVFATENLTAAEAAGAKEKVTWRFTNEGLEETVVNVVVSPPAGAPLVSAMWDYDGFRHDDLAAPAERGQFQPRGGSNRSLDFAERAPAVMVRTHDGGKTHGSLSHDGGATWTFFASEPAGVTANQRPGFVAVAADGGAIVWATEAGGVWVSRDDGATWRASKGVAAKPAGEFYAPVADRRDAARFYLLDATGRRVLASTDGGATFVVAASGLAIEQGDATLRAVAGREGELWLAAVKGGLWRSLDAGKHFARVATESVAEATRVGFGRAMRAAAADGGEAAPAVFLWGRVGGARGIFRSDDGGASWARINDDAHQFGWIHMIAGDPRIAGRVYLATGGRGIIYGEPAGAAR